MPRPPRTELAKLRRTRSGIHQQLNKLEPLLTGYRDKLAEVEAAIHAIDPELALPTRFRKPNPVFARGELTRFALAVLRDAGEPLPIRVIAVRMLALKGIVLPGPTLRREVRKRVRIAFAAMDKRGVTVRIGEGNAARKALSATGGGVGFGGG
jgi:hypothetical protein